MLHTKRQKSSAIIFHLFSVTKKSTPPTLEESIISDIAPITIDMHGVKSLLDNLDSHIATGPDNIPISRSLRTFAILCSWQKCQMEQACPIHFDQKIIEKLN